MSMEIIKIIIYIQYNLNIIIKIAISGRLFNWLMALKESCISVSYGLLPVFINKVLLVHILFIYLLSKDVFRL